MNKQNLKLLMLALALIGVTALGMSWLRTHQRLGHPGIKTAEIAGSRRLDIFLPQTVMDYASVVVPTDKEVLRGLPQDTSFAQRRYSPPGDESPFHTLWFNVVLMGSDRTSIHKPQFCLRGSGWDIDSDNSTFDTVHIESPHPYDLPIMKMLITRQVKDNQGKPLTIRGIYVYWFVADHDLTADHWTRMKKMAVRLLQTGELERWAYVSSLGVCLPGQEDATYGRMKKFIAAAAPQFQLAAPGQVASLKPAQTASR